MIAPVPVAYAAWVAAAEPTHVTADYAERSAILPAIALVLELAAAVELTRATAVTVAKSATSLVIAPALELAAAVE